MLWVVADTKHRYYLFLAIEHNEYEGLIPQQFHIQFLLREYKTKKEKMISQTLSDMDPRIKSRQ